MAAEKEGTRQEARARLLREGEVSPYKLLIAVLLRENFTTPEPVVGSEKSPESKITSLTFLNDLINSPDKPYATLSKEIADPENQLNPVVTARFNLIIKNVDNENACFLYDLVHSIIDMSDPSSVIILKKKIGNNSPFGKFLRLTLHSLQKMSYPQILHVYRQLCLYVNCKEEVRSEEDVVVPMETTSCVQLAAATDFQSQIVVPLEHIKIQSTSKILTPSPSVSTSSKSKKKYVPLSLESVEIASIVSPLAEMEIGAEVTVKNEPEPFTRISKPKRGLDVFQKMMRDRIQEDKSGLGPYLFNQFLFEKKFHAGTLTHDQEAAYNMWEMDKEEKVQEAKKSSTSLRQAWKPEVKPSILRSLDYTPLFPVHSIRLPPTPKKCASTPKKSSSSSNCPPNFTVYDQSNDLYYRSQLDSPVQTRTRSKMTRMMMSPATGIIRQTDKTNKTQRWLSTKCWSRKLIEKTIREIAGDLQGVKARLYTPEEVSSFLEAIKHNPSSQCLLPQLHFLEYLNSIRIKDITRCTESLRTSFDLRIKPEMNKGMPYAAYCFSVFYNFMGFDKDASSFLEEAFQSAHSAGDLTCLHYCLNLWSMFRGLTYNEISVPIKSVDGSLVELHCRNVISRAFEAHRDGESPEFIFELLAEMKGDGETVEVEALYLEALITFCSIFGWYKLSANYSEIILATELEWPSRVYAFALCHYAHVTLLNGNGKLASLVMDYGRMQFGYTAGPEGVLFGREDGIHAALEAELGGRPVDPSVIARISSYDRIECVYWMAYNEMVLNNYQGAGMNLKKLSQLLGSKRSVQYDDLKLRCLLFQAELECLCSTPVTGLTYLFEALELAESIQASFFIALCHINVASIQNEVGLTNQAIKSLQMDLSSIVRSTCPLLQTRLNLLNIKLKLKLLSRPIAEPPGPRSSKRKKVDPLFKDELTKMIAGLDQAKTLYEKWGNNYRLKECYYIEGKVYHFFEKDVKREEAMGLLEDTKSYLKWEEGTCVV